jgi:threonine synthase
MLGCELPGARLVCRKSGQCYATDLRIWKSPVGGLLDLEFPARFDWPRIRARPPTMWRYREALPIAGDQNMVSLGEPVTPLLAARLYGRDVLLKLEYLMPTGSFKDRGSSVLVSRIRELGIRRVVEDSSGNAGASLAAYCARAGIECDIYVPASVPAAKLAQIKACGARVHRVAGNRQAVAAAARRAAGRHYYASHSWNPYFVHGTKTIAFEIFEQLDGRLPDALILPVGNGTLLLGAYLGFCELLKAGCIDRLPRLVGVQTQRCCPLARAFKDDRSARGKARPGRTMADGIAVSDPVRAEQCLQAVRQTGGTFVTVSEQQIVDALRELARRGFVVEPTAAVSVAALAQGRWEGTVVIPLTGHGLKAPQRLARLLARKKCKR